MLVRSLIFRNLLHRYVIRIPSKRYSSNMDPTIAQLETWRISVEKNFDFLQRDLVRQNEMIQKELFHKLAVHEKDGNSQFELLNLKISQVDKRLDGIDHRLDKIETILYRSVGSILVAVFISILLPFFPQLHQKSTTSAQ